MSVYKPKGSETYVFDFQWRGRRFSGTTGKTIKREAEQVERERRDAVRRDSENAHRQATLPMTLDIACGRYWNEVGKNCKNPGQVEWAIDYLLSHLGEDKLLQDISNGDVATLVALRRGDRVDNCMVRKHAGKRNNRRVVAPKEAKLVSPATVNRSVIEPLRRIMLRASNIWQQKVGAVQWRKHKLKEPNERIKSLSEDEQVRLFAALPCAYHPIVFFALRTGCRAMECVNLRWADIDWGSRRISIVGKGDVTASVPLPTDLREMLFPLQTNRCDFVFTVLVAACDECVDVRSRRITYRAFYSAFRVATQRAGISGLRIHDLRHTAATRLVTKTGNLKMAQKLLRHASISTTARYAHVLDEDLRLAMDDMATQTVPSNVPQGAAKSQKTKH